MSPIDNLPVELLGRVFVHAIFASNGHPFELDGSSTNPYDITLVSRHWRDVARSTPQLWVILPGCYRQLWEGLIRRSGALPLCLRYNEEAPRLQASEVWSPKLLGGPERYKRLQGLVVKRYSCDLQRSLDHSTLSPSLRYVHLEGTKGFALWDIHEGFLPFVQSLPHLVYLGLGGKWIPMGVLNNGGPTSPRFKHPNLRHLWLRGTWSLIWFLENSPLRIPETLEVHAQCLPDIPRVEPLITVFRDFLEGRDEAPRTLSLSSDPSSSVLEIKIDNFGDRTEYDPTTPTLKLTVSGFREAPLEAWGKLVLALPSLKSVEEVALHRVQLYRPDAEHLLQVVPHTNRVVATGSDAKVVIIGAPQPIEVVPSGE